MMSFAIGRRMRTAACAGLFAIVVATGAQAEKADRDKNINFSADQPVEVDFNKRVGTLRGNVVITQGTLTIHADKIDFKQNPDNSLSATAWGNPISFREKKDDSDEYYEGYAQRAVYNGQTHTLELFDNALLKEGKNEFRGNYIAYNSETNMLKAEGRPNAPGGEGPGARVEGVFEPRSGNPLAPNTAPKSAPKGSAPAAKDAAKASAPMGTAAKGAASKDASKSSPAKEAAAVPTPPLALTPDSTLAK